MISNSYTSGAPTSLRVRFQTPPVAEESGSSLFRRPQSPPITQNVQDAVESPSRPINPQIQLTSILKMTPLIEPHRCSEANFMTIDPTFPTLVSVKNAIYSILDDTRQFNAYHSESLSVVIDTIYKDLHLNDELDADNLNRVKFVSQLINDAINEIGTENFTENRGPNFKRNSLALVNAFHYLENKFKTHFLFCTIDILKCTDAPLLNDYNAIEAVHDSFLEIMNGYPDINKGSSDLFFNDPNSEDTGFVTYNAFERDDHDSIVEILRDILTFTKAPISEDIPSLQHHGYIVRKALKKINYEEENTPKSDVYFPNKVALYNALYTIHKEFQVHRETRKVVLIDSTENPQFFIHYTKRDRVNLNDLFQTDVYGAITKPFIDTGNYRSIFHNSTKTDMSQRHVDQVGEGSFGRLREFVLQDLSQPNEPSDIGVVKKVRPRHLIEQFKLYRELKAGQEFANTTIALGAWHAFSYADSKKRSRSNIGLLMEKVQPISIDRLKNQNTLKNISDYIFQSAVRLGQLHNNGYSHGDFCMQNTLNISDDSNMILRLSDLGEIKRNAEDISILRLDKGAALGHFPSPDVIEWVTGNRESMDFQKNDTFSWALDVIYSCVQLQLLNNFPVYEPDYSRKGTNEGPEKNKVFDWVNLAILDLEARPNFLGSEPLKAALVSALQPVESRPTMDELCNTLLDPGIRESLENL